MLEIPDQVRNDVILHDVILNRIQDPLIII